MAHASLWKQIEEELQSVPDFLEGQEWKAFRDWAFKIIFSGEGQDDQLSWEDVRHATRIDGPGDMEIDGYRTDNEERIVHLFQAKYSEQPYKLSDLLKFVEAPNQLLHPDLRSLTTNRETLYLAAELKDRLAEGYGIALVVALSGAFHKRAERKWQELAEQPDRPFKVNGRELRVPTIYQRYDRKGLEDLFSKQLEETIKSKLNVELTLPGYHEFTANGYKVVSAFIYAKELVSLYHKYSERLFDEDPRFWVAGKTKVYKGMEQTLRTEKEFFHLLNNGLSATCDRLEIEQGEPARAKLEAFQIVNGYQTTRFLALNRTALTDNVYVALRITETPSPQLSRRIAETTNTQIALKAQDFRANEKQQRELQEQFRRLEPPWFYERKRGEWEVERDKPRFREGKRYLTMKDVAQATLAFIGRPGEAFEDTRYIFEKNSEHPRGHYEDAFPPGVTADQLLLTALVHREVRHRIPSEPEHVKEVLNYGELHLVWTIGEYLRTKYRDQVDTKSLLLQVDISAELTKSIAGWFNNFYLVAVNALNNAVTIKREVAVRTSEEFDNRNFYRSRRDTARYNSILRQIRTSSLEIK